MVMPPVTPIRVTEHAIIRYLERAMGFNIEAVREHIAGVCAGPAALGAVCVRAEGLRFEITNSTVTTITPDRQNPSKTGMERNRQAIRRAKENRSEV